VQKIAITAKLCIIGDFMENLTHVGDFKTNGNIRVSDPCYDKKTWCSGKIKVKPGKYRAYIKCGDIDNWGYRVQSLYIVHEKFKLKDLTFKKTEIDVGVDSGQCGFFNDELYKKKLKTPVPLVGHEEYDSRDNLWRAENDSGCNLDLMEKLLKGTMSDKDFKKYKSDEKKDKAKRLKEAKERAENIDPEKCKKSNDFYEVCCSMTLGNLKAGVEDFGVVSSSGFGDGSYDCFVNEGKEVIASYIEFIGEDEDEEEED